MRKTVSALLAALFAVVCCSFSVSAVEEFEISNGVLVRYNGDSFSVSVPDGVWKIGDEAFMGKSTTRDVTLPDSVTEIGNRAFYNCTTLQEINNTGNIAEIGSNAFYNTALVNFSDSDFVDINGILVAYEGNAGGVRIPEGIRRIAPYVFAQNTEIETAEIPESVTYIGEGAFYRCARLAQIEMTKNVSYIGPLALDGTAWLENYSGDFVTAGRNILVKYKGDSRNVTLPYGVEQICAAAFYENQTVCEVTIPNTCLGIQMRAFADCPNLLRVKIPQSVVGIDASAFENSSGVTIEAVAGSFAHRFAQDYSVAFEIVSGTAISGDVDGSGETDSADATLILQVYAGILTEDALKNSADLDGNGETDSADATLVLQIYAGIV